MRHTGSELKSVVQRAAQILNAFGDATPPLYLTDICVMTGLPKATVHRILMQLMDAGIVERVERGYVPGRALWEVAHFTIYTRLRNKARPYLAELYRATHQTVHFATLNESDVVYLEKLPGHSPQPTTRVGGRQPSHCTALGKAMLAFQPTERVDAVIARGLGVPTLSTESGVAEFRVALDDVASVRYAVDSVEQTPGFTCMAVPVLDPLGTSGAAISLTGPAASFQRDPFRTALMKTAGKVSKACREELAEYSQRTLEP